MFGERLQALRKEKGLTQKDIADLLKVAPSTVGMYEQGRRDPDTETLKLLAEFFNVSIDTLLDHEERTVKSPATLTIKEQDKLDKESQKVLDNFKMLLSKNKEYFEEEDYMILETSVRSAMEAILLKNKEKYTPKKHKNPKK